MGLYNRVYIRICSIGLHTVTLGSWERKWELLFKDFRKMGMWCRLIRVQILGGHQNPVTDGVLLGASFGPAEV